MDTKISLSIVNPTGQVYKKDVATVVVSGKEGDIGFKAGHIPYLVELTAGVIEIYENSGKMSESIYVSGGFAEVSSDKVTILADDADRASNLSEDEILRAKEEAEKTIKELGTNHIRYDELLSITIQSVAKLDAIKRLKKKVY